MTDPDFRVMAAFVGIFNVNGVVPNLMSMTIMDGRTCWGNGCDLWQAVKVQWLPQDDYDHAD